MLAEWVDDAGAYFTASELEAAAFPGRSVVVELAAVTDAGAMVELVATTLSVSPSMSCSHPRGQTREHIAHGSLDRRVCLVPNGGTRSVSHLFIASLVLLDNLDGPHDGSSMRSSREASRSEGAGHCRELVNSTYAVLLDAS